MKKAAELFKILSVDKRIEIIEMLKNGPEVVSVLAEQANLSPSAMSQHLRVLKSAGLIQDKRKGYYVQYSLNVEALEEVRKRLNRICTCGCQETPITILDHL